MLLLVAMLLGVAAHPTTPDTLGTAEVTAARHVAGIRTPVSVQRLDSAAFTVRGITDMGDALRRFSGVNLRDYGGAGGLKTVSVRGLGAAHTAVSYDGLCVSDSRQGEIDLGQFAVENLGSIELQVLDQAALLCPVRQLASAVVSLSTRSTMPADRRWHGTFEGQQGAFDTWSPYVGLSKRVSSRSYVGTQTRYFFADNDYPFTVANGNATTHWKRENSRMQSVTTELNWTMLTGKSGSIRSKAYFHHNYRHLPGMVHYYVNGSNERLLEQTAFAQSRWQQRWGRWEAFAAGKYNWQTSQYSDVGAGYPGGRLDQNYWQREAYLTAGASYDVLSWLRAAYAADYAHASLNSNLRTDNHVSRDSWLQSLSLQLRTSRVQLTARAQMHRYWNQSEGGASSARDARRLLPSVTASVLTLRSPFVLYVRGGYKESFRMPTFTESYYYHQGSTDLKPELSRQLSLGLTLQAAPTRWWPLLALTADAYCNRVRDRIVSIPINLFLWKTANLGDVRTAGLDLTLQSTFRPAPRHSIMLSANYSLTRCTDHTSPTSSSWHKQLAYTPQHSGSASLTWEDPWLSLVVHCTYASMRWNTHNHLPTTDLPAYSEWGMAAYHAFALRRGQTLTLRADLQNAFDERYEVIRRYPMPGRAYKLSLKYKF